MQQELATRVAAIKSCLPLKSCLRRHVDSVVEGVGVVLVVVLIGYPIMFLLAYVTFKLLSKFVWWITL